MTFLGNIKEIFCAKQEQKTKMRQKMQELIFLEKYGIFGDKFAGKNENRAVMIIGINAYNLAKNNNIKLEFGTLGENILVDFDPHILEKDSILILNEVQLQVTSKCNICKHLSIFNEDLPDLLKQDRGIYCKVLNNGKINKNTKISLKDKE